MKKLLSTFLPLCLLFGVCGCGESSKPGPSPQPTESDYWTDSARYGIYVSNGVMMLGDEAFYGIGMNYFSLFGNCIKSAGFDTSEAFKGLETLSEYGIPVIRFNCGVYYGRDLRNYANDREGYLATLKAIADKAEECRVGLIPSFFWHWKAVPDYVGETGTSWGDENSKTVEFLRTYAADVVNTLKDSRAVFGWEFGNEYNLEADLPGRSDPDSDIDAESIVTAYGIFAETVSSLDTHGRMITSGNASLREAQYHLFESKSWQADTQAQHDQMQAYFHSAGMDVVSEHNYFLEYKLAEGTLTLYEYMKHAVEVCRADGKGYFVGEFGGSTLEEYEEMCRTMMSTRVQLSLVWNFDPLGLTEHSYTESDEKGQFLFPLLKQINAEYRELVSD